MWTLSGVALGVAFMIASALAVLVAATILITTCALIIGRYTTPPS